MVVGDEQNRRAKDALSEADAGFLFKDTQSTLVSPMFQLGCSAVRQEDLWKWRTRQAAAYIYGSEMRGCVCGRAISRMREGQLF